MKIDPTAPALWRTIYQSFNGLVSASVLYTYWTNPLASAIEHLPDSCIHGLESLNLNSVDAHSFLLALNMIRAAQATDAYLSENSTIPHQANGIDILLHTVNMTYHYLSLSSSPQGNDSCEQNKDTLDSAPNSQGRTSQLKKD